MASSAKSPLSERILTDKKLRSTGVQLQQYAVDISSQMNYTDIGAAITGSPTITQYAERFSKGVTVANNNNLNSIVEEKHIGIRILSWNVTNFLSKQSDPPINNEDKIFALIEKLNPQIVTLQNVPSSFDEKKLAIYFPGKIYYTKWGASILFSVYPYKNIITLDRNTFSVDFKFNSLCLRLFVTNLSKKSNKKSNIGSLLNESSFKSPNCYQIFAGTFHSPSYSTMGSNRIDDLRNDGWDDFMEVAGLQEFPQSMSDGLGQDTMNRWTGFEGERDQYIFLQGTSDISVAKKWPTPSASGNTVNITGAYVYYTDLADALPLVMDFNDTNFPSPLKALSSSVITTATTATTPVPKPILRKKIGQSPWTNSTGSVTTVGLSNEEKMFVFNVMENESENNQIPKKTKKTLRILSWNLENSRNPSQLLDQIAKLNPDLLVLQNVPTTVNVGDWNNRIFPGKSNVFSFEENSILSGKKLLDTKEQKVSNDVYLSANYQLDRECLTLINTNFTSASSLTIFNQKMKEISCHNRIMTTNLPFGSSWVDSFQKVGNSFTWSTLNGKKEDFLYLNNKFGYKITGSHLYYSQHANHLGIVLDISLTDPIVRIKEEGEQKEEKTNKTTKTNKTNKKEKKKIEEKEKKEEKKKTVFQKTFHTLKKGFETFNKSLKKASNLLSKPWEPCPQTDWQPCYEIDQNKVLSTMNRIFRRKESIIAKKQKGGKKEEKQEQENSTTKQQREIYFSFIKDSLDELLEQKERLLTFREPEYSDEITDISQLYSNLARKITLLVRDPAYQEHYESTGMGKYSSQFESLAKDLLKSPEKKEEKKEETSAQSYLTGVVRSLESAIQMVTQLDSELDDVKLEENQNRADAAAAISYLNHLFLSGKENTIRIIRSHLKETKKIELDQAVDRLAYFLRETVPADQTKKVLQTKKNVPEEKTLKSKPSKKRMTSKVGIAKEVPPSQKLLGER